MTKSWDSSMIFLECGMQINFMSFALAQLERNASNYEPWAKRYSYEQATGLGKEPAKKSPKMKSK
jgi:hypothetical protein